MRVYFALPAKSVAKILATHSGAFHEQKLSILAPSDFHQIQSTNEPSIVMIGKGIESSLLLKMILAKRAGVLRQPIVYLCVKRNEQIDAGLVEFVDDIIYLEEGNEFNCAKLRIKFSRNKILSNSFSSLTPTEKRIFCELERTSEVNNLKCLSDVMGFKDKRTLSVHLTNLRKKLMC